MKKTVFNQLHRDAGARMVEFAGFDMPVEFSGIRDEHLTVRKGVGVFDISHMGEFWVRGPHASELVQYVTSNDISVLREGQAQYSCFPNGQGGIVDDLLVYCFGPEKYMLVVNASNIEKDWNWLNSLNRFEARLENTSDRTAQLAVQGPKAMEVLQQLTPVKLENISYYAFVTGTLAGVENVIISATGYTGSGGFELYFAPEDGETIYRAIFEDGKAFGIKPIGLGARDTLRLEMGYCLYGNDIDDQTSPLEAGLGWITRFSERNMFVNRDRLQAHKDKGPGKILRGFEMIDRGIPRHGYPITDEHGNVIGRVTSGTQSPVLNKGIGMGYVAKARAAFGTEIYIQIRGKMLKARVVRMPFVHVS
ncbi:MAG: glycine cleavage system aminomethyltransferase GcvT [Mangrovibacterium sp.]